MFTMCIFATTLVDNLHTYKVLWLDKNDLLLLSGIFGLLFAMKYSVTFELNNNRMAWLAHTDMNNWRVTSVHDI